jgi:hypothetical protein
LGRHSHWMEIRRQMDIEFETPEEYNLSRASPISAIISTSTCADDGSIATHQGSDDGALSLSHQVELVVPSPRDVLLGGLKLTQTQFGNANFRRFVEDYRDEYERSTSKLEKIKIAKKIVSEIKAGGARFLKQTDYKYGKDGKMIKKEKGSALSIGWVEVPDHVAREKISHAFRNLRAKKSKSSGSTGTIHESELGVSATTRSNAIAYVAYGGGDSDREGSGCTCAGPSGAFGGCMSGGHRSASASSSLLS